MANISKINNLEELLECKFGKQIDILKCTEKMLVGPGENYGSVIIALDVLLKFLDSDLKAKTIHLVAKLCPPSEKLCQVFNIQETLKKEISFYVDVIPALEKFQQKYNSKHENISNLFANCFGGRINLKTSSSYVDENPVLLLENLLVSDYEIGDRLIGLDLINAELILENLAIFHAVPIAMKLQEPELFRTRILPTLKGIEFGYGIDKNCVESMAVNLENLLKTKEKCAPHINLIVSSIRKFLIGPYRTTKGSEPFATIAHTDFWINNIMIRKSENGEPVENKFLDFQLIAYNSPIYDLLFFLYGSIQPSVLYPNLEHLIQLYYNTFINCLKDFNVDISLFSWDLFQEEIKTVAPLELGHILIMFKTILTKRGQITELASVDDNVLCSIDIVTEDFEERIADTALSFIKNNWI